MGIFEWCLKQKDGLKKTKPNKKLCDEFLEKSRDDLEVAALMFENKKFEWFIIVNYYAMYHAAVALLALVGYKSRNHTCTKIALEEIFIKHNKEAIETLEWLDDSYEIKEELLKAFSEAKNLREQVQYEIKDILPQLARSEKETTIQFIEEMNEMVNRIKRSGKI